jgi:hypothetical protein
MRLIFQADWSPITKEQANVSPANAYRASKTFAVRFLVSLINEGAPTTNPLPTGEGSMGVH